MSGPASPTIVTLLTIRSDSLIGRRERAGDTLRIALHDLSRLDLRTGTRSRWLTGAAIGAAAGLGIGAALGVAVIDSDLGQGFDAVAGMVLGIPAGALIGGVVGANFRTDRWSEVPLDQLRRRMVATRPAGFGIGISWQF